MTVSYDGKQTCEQRSLVVRTCYRRTDRNYAMECASRKYDPTAQSQQNHVATEPRRNRTTVAIEARPLQSRPASRSCRQSWLAPTRPSSGRRRARAQKVTRSDGSLACRRAGRPAGLPGWLGGLPAAWLLTLTQVDQLARLRSLTQVDQLARLRSLTQVDQLPGRSRRSRLPASPDSLAALADPRCPASPAGPAGPAGRERRRDRAAAHNAPPRSPGPGRRWSDGRYRLA